VFCRRSFGDSLKLESVAEGARASPFVCVLQVIRWKLAEMARQIECTHAMLETLTYQMDHMSKEEQNSLLGGDTALIKVSATKCFEYCAREAAQIFGGAAYVRGGQGEKVERLYREVRAYAIPGGSEEIMLDLGVRQAVRNSKM